MWGYYACIPIDSIDGAVARIRHHTCIPPSFAQSAPCRLYTYIAHHTTPHPSLYCPPGIYIYIHIYIHIIYYT